jgi:tryptophan halogenase
MFQKNDSILIVGGGSSGWMTAATLIKAFPEKNITLIESPNIPTIGVGESTISEFNVWLDFLDIDYRSFITSTNAALKYGIGFTNFTKENGPTIFFPFGHGNLENTVSRYDDWYFKKVFFPENTKEDFLEFYFPQAQSIKTNKVAIGDPGTLFPFTSDRDVSFQFDATKFGLWLSENYAKPRGVKHIKAEVVKINGDENGVESLVTSDGQVLKADFYIDCTGFKSILLGGFLKQEFHSTKDILPNDRAWAAPMQYTDKNIEMQNYTNCTGIENGWVWNTPLWNRIGTGYVYCSEFVDDETALQEFKNHLDSDKMLIVNKNRSDSMDFRQIQIKNGYYKKTWVKNVCAIGLAAGFLEPLESTGLLMTHQLLLELVNSLSRGETVQFDRDIYNKKTLYIFETAAIFVALHYALSKRKDTPYWRYVTGISYPEEAVLHLKNNCRTFQGSLFSGYDFTPVTDVEVKDMQFKSNRNIKTIYKNSFDQRDILRKTWEDYISKCPTHYEYLRDTYYNED